MKNNLKMQFTKLLLNSSLLIICTVAAKNLQLDIESPPFVCPKALNSTFEKPDYFIIKIKSKDMLKVTWRIRWTRLSKATQRFTLLLWKKVRALEKRLNNLLSEELAYKILNDELLSGVKYKFEITATFNTENITQSVFMNYIEERLKGKADIFNVDLLGSRVSYVDIEFILEAHVTSCWELQNHYFIWTISNIETNHSIDVSTTGSRLEISPYSFKPGSYEITCQVVAENDHKIMKKIIVLIDVLKHQRGLELYLNVDKLTIPKEVPFTLESLIINHDNKEYSLQHNWQCYNVEGIVCDFFDSIDESAYNFSFGISDTGEYKITLTITTSEQSANATATIIVIPEILPVLDIKKTYRIVNENDKKTLYGRATNVAPSCSLTWHFKTDDSENLEYCMFGKVISDPLTLFSKEENFLDELADFQNDTKSVDIEANFVAETGKARLIAKCGDSYGNYCENSSLVFAEVSFHMNEAPKIKNVTIAPVSGTALETMFRITTHAVDAEGPLLYSFYTSIGANSTLLLASYLEWAVLETFLPYYDGETKIWVTVCDVLGACTESETQLIQVLPSYGKTLDLLINNIKKYIKRCELLHFLHTAVSIITSYSNGGSSKNLSIFTTSLVESLPGLNRCVSQQKYNEILGQLADVGLDISL